MNRSFGERKFRDITISLATETKCGFRSLQYLLYSECKIINIVKNSKKNCVKKCLYECKVLLSSDVDYPYGGTCQLLDFKKSVPYVNFAYRLLVYPGRTITH